MSRKMKVTRIYEVRAHDKHCGYDCTHLRSFASSLGGWNRECSLFDGVLLKLDEKKAPLRCAECVEQAK